MGRTLITILGRVGGFEWRQGASRGPECNAAPLSCRFLGRWVTPDFIAKDLGCLGLV